MIKKVGVFAPKWLYAPRYSWYIRQALLKRGVEAPYYPLHDGYDPRELIQQLAADRPDCCFVVMGKTEESLQVVKICEQLEIPCVVYGIDLYVFYDTFLKSPHTIIAGIETTAPAFFKKHFNFDRSLVLFHAADELIPAPKEKEFDVVFFGKCFDYEQARQGWLLHLPKSLASLMDIAAEMALAQGDKMGLIEAMAAAFGDKIPWGDFKENTVWRGLAIQLEWYVRGRHRVEMIKAIRDASVTVFGDGSWHKYLGGQSNVSLRPLIPFEESIKMMTKSKLVLNSAPCLAFGGHERFFLGTAAGSLVVTNDTVFMRENFTQGVDSAVYRYGNWSALNETVRDYVADDDKRERVWQRSADKVMREHTWERRVDTLLHHLPAFLK